MFGGVGYFYRDVMFALQAREELYLKVDERNQGDFEAAGSGPFTYLRAGKERVLGSYWRLPEETMDDEEVFLAWTRLAVEAALAADRKKQGKG